MKTPLPVARKYRCAVYTRKSSEEGLEQEFNSLDAQREACEAYIISQKAEGWLLVSDRYDDGGISGATLDRPALKRLLADIEAHKVDVVVVYKIDRLSRALMDFAKLVEVFDRNNVTSVDWNTYKVAKAADIPELEIVLLNHPNLPPSGAGEPSSRPTAAAINNAIFDATGARVRQAPLTAQRVKAALTRV